MPEHALREPLVNIRGARVALGPLRADLIDTYARWNNDFGTMRTQGDLPGPRSMERTTAWYQRISGATDSVWYLIYEMDTWEPIGITWLADIDYRNRTAGFAISIGEESKRGKAMAPRLPGSCSTSRSLRLGCTMSRSRSTPTTWPAFVPTRKPVSVSMVAGTNASWSGARSSMSS